MYNWNIDTKILKRNDEEYSIWKLEQLINFGLNDEKLSESELRKYWKKLVIDPERKKVLQMWLWSKQS
ncbi:hypothetical protein M1145_02385 [Patescibacteria group bacterium]|nr:hypothetical protein [Patescibacteria group bacterium]